MAIVSSTCVDALETRTLLRTTNDAVHRPGAALALPRHASSTTYLAQLRALRVTLRRRPQAIPLDETQRLQIEAVAVAPVRVEVADGT